MKLFIFTLMLLQSIQQTWDSANADMEAGRWMDAAAKFELVLKEDPAHIPSQFNLAVCLTKEGQPEKAIDVYRKIIEQDPDIFEVRINLGILLEGSEAADQFERAVALRPLDADTRITLGLLYMSSNQVELAFPHLSKAEELGASRPELFIALSEAEHSRGNDAASRSWLEKASTLDPSNKNVRKQLGLIYRESREFSKAIDMLKPALPEAKLELALSYFDNRNFAEAALLFEELVQADSNNVDLLYILGKSYMEQQQFPKAMLMFQRVLQLNPEYIDAYSSMGTISYVREDWVSAAQFFLRFLELRPGQPVAHFIVANCLDKLGKVKEAAVHYTKFLELDTGSNDVQSFQARQRLKLLERRLSR